MNHVTLSGRFVTDPALKYTPAGHAVCNVRLAVNRGKDEADFVDLEIWRGSAEFASQYLSKGNRVLVSGRLRIRPWVAQDGTKRKSTEIVVHELISLEKGNGGAAPAGGEEAESMGPATDEDFNDPFQDQ